MDYQSRWIREIVALQQPDGSWGCFHALSNPTKSQPLTTEQALRRLKILGLTAKDEPIQRAISYIESCLKGEREIPDRREKGQDWDLFVSRMLATWLKVFAPQNQRALAVAARWAEIVEAAFRSGTYNHSDYIQAYTSSLGAKPRGNLLLSFYQVALLQNMLSQITEKRVLDYIIHNETGIYYVYQGRLVSPPREFASKQASRYLGAIELLAGYSTAKESLGFIAEWLYANQGEDGTWDMGPSAKDGVYFPLSDSWRSAQTRKQDCTQRIRQLLNRLDY